MKKSSTLIILASLVVVCTVIAVTASSFSDKPEIVVAGELRIDDSISDYAIPNRTLFLVIYSQDPSKPMPLAIMKEPIRVSEGGFIRKFSISPDKLQRMMSHDPIPKTFRIKARLDRDGQGGPDAPGDVITNVTDIQYGSENVVIKFDQKI